jgi:hypothetical protein
MCAAQTAWGHHSLATAFKLLVTEAVQDPLNQRFQLLCPATIPIRPPLFTHEQLIAEEASRIGTFSQVQLCDLACMSHISTKKNMTDTAALRAAGDGPHGGLHLALPAGHV